MTKRVVRGIPDDEWEAISEAARARGMAIGEYIIHAHACATARRSRNVMVLSPRRATGKAKK